MQRMECYSILTDTQHGFWEKLSLECQLILAMHDLVQVIED